MKWTRIEMHTGDAEEGPGESTAWSGRWRPAVDNWRVERAARRAKEQRIKAAEEEQEKEDQQVLRSMAERFDWSERRTGDWPKFRVDNFALSRAKRDAENAAENAGRCGWC